MSNRYLDENGEPKYRWQKKIDASIKTREDALRFFKLMGIKAIQTKRQEKNGTTVFELPIRKLSYTGNSYAYRYAIYDSGYIRDVSEHCHSPWYINKRYETKSKYWNSYYKEYYTYTGNKPVFIDNFDDQLVYLANYILKNRYGSKLYSCCDFGIEQMKEQREFMYDHKWRGNTITISRDEYNELKYKNPLATTEEMVTIPANEYGAMCAKIDANELEEISSKSSVRDTVSIPRDAYIKFKKAYDRQCDDIQVIINGTRYNLS